MIQKPATTQVRPTAGRLPPQDLDAEAAVLSAILLVPEAYDAVSSILLPHYFYSDANRRIYEGIVELRATGSPVDIVTVASRLRDRQRLSQVGGTPYLYQLTDATPAVGNVASHARVVREKFRIRRAIEVCQRTAVEGYGDVGDVQQYLESAEEALGDIAHSEVDGKLRPLSEIVGRAHSYLQTVHNQRSPITGTPSGFLDLDAMTAGMHDTDLIVCAARPGVGKTSFLLNILTNVSAPRRVTVAGEDPYAAPAEEEVPGPPTALFSLEMPAVQIALRMICSEARINFNIARRGRLDGAGWNHVTNAVARLSKMPIYVDDTAYLSVAEMRSRCRQLSAELRRSTGNGKLALVGVDYLQLVRPAAVERISREQQVSGITADSKRMAKELELPVLILAQLNREVEKRTDHRPQLSDLRESGGVEQDADTVLFLYRGELYRKDDPELRGKAELLIAKQRNGPTGSVSLVFQKESTRFENAAERWSDEFDDFDR
jgi:replicative DNA helicase